MNNRYFSYGLTIESREALTRIPRFEDSGGVADVRIVQATDVPEALPSPVWSTLLVEVGSDRAALFRIDGLGRVLVRGGNEMLCCPASGVRFKDLECLLVGPAAGALQHQRGVLALCGSAVRYRGRTIILAGSPRCGKSAVAAEFMRRGAEVLCDDLCAVTFGNDGHPVVHVESNSVCLWPDCVSLSDPTGYVMRAGHSKRVIPGMSANPGRSVQVDAIVKVQRLLAKEPSMRAIRRIEVLDGAVRHSPEICRALDGTERMFTQLARLAAAVPSFSLLPAEGAGRVRDCVALIHEALGL